MSNHAPRVGSFKIEKECCEQDCSDDAEVILVVLKDLPGHQACDVTLGFYCKVHSAVYEALCTQSVGSA